MHSLALLPFLAAQAPAAPVLYHDLFGECVDSAGDVDGDGVPDLWVGDPSTFAPAQRGLQRVWCVSGKDGSTLLRIDSPADADEFGQRVAGLGDVDGDGARDVAVGCRHVEQVGARSPTGEEQWRIDSRVAVHSGRDGSLLYSLRDAAERVEDAAYRYRESPPVASVGDWNADQFDDFAVGWVYANERREERGRVQVVSGRDGSTLHAWLGLEAYDHFGCSLARVGDVDGDGRFDLAAGAAPRVDRRASAPEAKRRSRSGYVRVLSSTGTILRTLHPTDGSRSFGSSLAFAPGTKPTGVDELLVGQPGGRQSRVAVTRWKLSDGTLTQSLTRPSLDEWDGGWHNRNVTPRSTEVEPSFGMRLLAVPDRDGDERSDVLTTVPQFFCHVPAGVLSSKPSEDGRSTPIGRVELGELGFQYAEVGRGLCAAGDVDADSFDEFAVSGGDITCNRGCTGCVVLVSGRTLRVLRAFTRAGRT